MTVTTSSNKVQWTGNGATYVFTYSFYIPITATVELIHTTAAGVQTVVAGGAFSITTGGPTGGSLTYPLTGPAIPAGDTLTLVRIIPFTQPESLSNQGGLWPSAIEQGGLDNLELQIQQVNENVGRALQFNIADSAALSPVLPPASARAGLALIFDSFGNATAELPGKHVHGIRRDAARRDGGIHRGSAGRCWAGPGRAARPYSPMSYGADPTGVADSTAAFTACFAAAQAAGIAMRIPAGTFTLSAVPAISGPISVRGDGRRDDPAVQ